MTVESVTVLRPAPGAAPGAALPAGAQGLSAFQLAASAGFVGTLSQWLASLVGAAGASAYQVAVANGYGGTQAQWLTALVGAPGTPGLPGNNGLNGSTWYAGSGGPSGATGANGDFYLNTATGDLYGPKAAGAWSSPALNITATSGAILFNVAQALASAQQDQARANAGVIGRSLVLNGNFFSNTRGLSGTVTLGAGGRGHDCWKAGAGGCTYTFSMTGLDTILTISAGSLLHVIDPMKVDGGAYVLSQAGSAQMRAAVSGGSTSGAYAAGPLPITGAAAGQSVTVEFSTGTLSKAKLEPGTVATSFERRRRADEAAEIATYIRKVGRGGFLWAVTSNEIEYVYTLSPPMRVAPTPSSTLTGMNVTRAGVGNTALSFGPTIDLANSVQGGRYLFYLGAGSVTQGEVFTSLQDDILLLTAEL